MNLSRGLVVVTLVVLAFGFLGSRGLWEPDEGRYVGAARAMVLSGDWVVPQLNGAPHFTKPPLTYWAIGGGLTALGMNEWGARLYLGLAFLGIAALVGVLGNMLLGRGRGLVAAFVFATALLPFAAASTTTADAILTLFTTASVVAYWGMRKAETSRARAWWQWGFGAALGLAFLTKGPPGLLQVLPIALFELLSADARHARFRWANWRAWVAFAIVAVPWFAIVVARFPGLLEYFVVDEVWGRVATDRHGRNAAWFKAFEIYGTALLIGGLPWTPLWLLALRDAWRRGARATWSRLRESPERLFLVLWFAVPFSVFCLARSRMLLYALPIFVPLAILTAERLAPLLLRVPRTGWRRVAIAAAAVFWCTGLLGLRVLSAELPFERDARRMAALVHEAAGTPPAEFVVVDERIHGLEFYLGTPARLVSSAPQEDPAYWPRPVLAQELAEAARTRQAYLARPERAREITDRLVAQGMAATYRAVSKRVALVLVEPADPVTTPRLAVVTEPAAGVERFRMAEMLRETIEEDPGTRIIVVDGEGRAVRHASKSGLARLLRTHVGTDVVLAAPEPDTSPGDSTVIAQHVATGGAPGDTMSVVWALPGATYDAVQEAARRAPPGFRVLVDESAMGLGSAWDGLFDACLSLHERAPLPGPVPDRRVTVCRNHPVTTIASADGESEILLVDAAVGVPDSSAPRRR